jgi:hypothetical protein
MNLRKLFGWAGIPAVSLITALLLVLLGLEFLVSDNYVAKMVTKISGNWIDAQVKVEKVNLSVFSHFPYAGIQLEEGHIVTQTDISPSRADTLLSFGKFTFLFNPVKLLWGGVDIRGIKLESPKLYAYISKDGKPNWEILKTGTDTVAVETDSLESDFNLNVNVREIAISERGHFTFDSRTDKLRASLFLNSLQLQGRFTNNLSKIHIRKGNFSKVNIAAAQSGANRASVRFSIDTLDIGAPQRGTVKFEAKTRTNLRVAGNSFARNLPLDISGRINRKGRQRIELEDCRINLANIPVVANGILSFDGTAINTENLVARIEEFPLNDLLAHVPQTLVPDIEKIGTNTRLSVDAGIYGSYNPTTGELPRADISFRIPHSYISVEGQKEQIKDLYLEGSYHFRANDPDSNMVTIKQLAVDGDGIMIGGKGYVSNLLGDPYINMDMAGYVNLDSAVRMLPAGTDIYGSGTMDANVQINSKLSNLTPYNLGKANIKGNVSAKDIKLGMPSQKIFCNIFGGEINANTKGLDLKLDSTYIRYADSLLVKGRNIGIAAKNVKPFSGNLTAQSLSLYGADSTNLRISGANAGFVLEPYKGNDSVPSIRLNSSIRRLSFRQDVNFATITGGNFNLEAHQNNLDVKRREMRMSRLADSLQLIYPQIARDSLLGHWLQERRKSSGRQNIPDEFTQEDYNFRLTDKGILYLLNRWDISGSLNAGRIRVATPMFPLRNRIEDPHMKFNLNSISIEKGNIHSGSSSFAVSGEVSGIKGALSRGSRLKAILKVDADTLNFNELTRALSAGEEYMAKGAAYKDFLMKADNEESLENAIALEGADSLNRMSLIIIPRNIEATLDMNVKYGIYSSIVLHKASGKVNSRNRCLQITDFNATTSAGAMDLNAFYRTRSREDLAAGFDLQFTDMDMGEFIRLYPGMDTLLPMLKSFEGIINCQIAATTQIDTNMNVVLPTIEGVARIKGDSLVLLDGETFAEIAKMLKFKNREKNLVDSIAVEVSIKDNQIEVYPFIMKMDRYTTAISGKQDLDMNLDYHISVLKSPLPMRMGINISGNMDDFKFGIGKAKYKDTNLPVYSKVIDSTRVNLLEKIKDIYKE